MEVESLLAAAMTAIPRAQFAAIIDLPSGMFLGVQPQPDTTSALDLFAATVKEIYDGEMSEGLRVPGLAAASAGGGGGQQRVNLFVISGEESLYVMVRMHAQPHLVLAVACPVAANIGMSLVKARHLAQIHEIDGV